MKRALLQSALVVGLGTTSSRLLGFLREVLMAVFFGTSLAKSAFDIAFKIPNLFRRLFGEGALSAAFVPVFTETRKQEGLHAAGQLAGRVAGLMALVLGATVICGWVGLFAIEALFDIGPKATEVFRLLRVMLPYTIFICLVALCMGIQNSLGRFAVPAFTPVLMNVIWIVGLFTVCPLMGDAPRERIYGLAWCVVVAGIVQIAVQFPALRHLGITLRFRIAWGDKRVRHMLLLMGPAALGMGIHQVNAVVDSVLAIIVADWAPAALTYAERLIYLPLGIIATAFGTVLLPTYAKQAVQGDPGVIGDTLSFAFRNVLLVMGPAAVGLCVLSEPITSLVYQWRGGAFDHSSVVQTSRALAFYAPGLIVFSIYKVVVPAFYALQDTRTPLRVGVWTVVLNFALNLLFVFTWPEGYKHAGLAMATVIASLVNGGVLALLLSKRIGGLPWRALGQGLFQAGRMTLAVGLVAHFAYGWIQGTCPRLGLTGKAAEFASTGGAIAGSLIVFACMGWVTNRDELRRLLRRRN
jgi:putative peptidoglycan lipid II flippase